MDYTMKLAYQSNYWYNDGLKKAQIYDLTGAITSLRKSLQYNQSNIAARNLLGLVYYGRGDVVEALVEWILSKNFQSHNNIANYYISKVQEVPGELEAINQAVKRYNQSLTYAQQKGEDLAIIQLKKAVAAHPTFVKAHQLLALMYLKTEQYTNARIAIRAAQKLDTTDPITLAYVHEITQIRKERNAKLRGTNGQEKQTVTYNIGNESIIQPASSVYKEHSGLHTVFNIGLGVVVGVAVMWFLIMPAIMSSRQEKINNQTVEFSDQIATQEAQISALKVELEQYRSSSEESENAKQTAESTQEMYETLMNVSEHYSANDMSDDAMLEEMLKINPEALGTVGRDRYEEIKESLFPRMCEELYATSKKNYEVANYSTGISNLEKVISMDETYDDGGALLLLAQCYEKNGEQDKANIKYQQILEDFKDTEAAEEAQKALDAQNGVESEEGEDGADGEGTTE